MSSTELWVKLSKAAKVIKNLQPARVQNEEKAGPGTIRLARSPQYANSQL